MIFNTVNGGLISTITVNTAVGASVSCTLSSISYTATANNNGVAVFTVHVKGTWTCTSSKGGVTKSGTVSITGNGESKSITLTLQKYLYNNGTQNVAWARGGQATFATNFMNLASHSYFTTDSAQDLTPFSYIVVKHKTQSGSSVMRGGCSTNKPTYGPPTDVRLDITSTTTEATTKINISSVTGNKYVCFNIADGDYIRIYEVYLEG